MKQTGSL